MGSVCVCPTCLLRHRPLSGGALGLDEYCVMILASNVIMLPELVILHMCRTHIMQAGADVIGDVLAEQRSAAGLVWRLDLCLSLQFFLRC